VSLTYFDAKAVMQALLDAGLGEKTLFGGYSNAHTAQWADIVRRFEAGSIHLADAASAMAQAVGYELPALKKEAARAEKELSELVRRQGEYERLAAAAEERYVAACDKKGLGTDCSREEIGRRLRESRSLLRATLGCPDAARTPLFSDEHSLHNTASLPAARCLSPYLPISPHISPQHGRWTDVCAPPQTARLSLLTPGSRASRRSARARRRVGRWSTTSRTSATASRSGYRTTHGTEPTVGSRLWRDGATGGRQARRRRRRQGGATRRAGGRRGQGWQGSQPAAP